MIAMNLKVIWEMPDKKKINVSAADDATLVLSGHSNQGG